MVIRKGRTSQVKVKAQAADRKGSDDVLFIGTLGVNCLEYTLRTIDTVDTAAKQVHFVYVDNGSKDPEGICEAVREHCERNPDIDYCDSVINGRNDGVGNGWNQLVRMAGQVGATKILICNNDIAFGPHTIDGLIEAYDKLREHVPQTVMVTATNHTKNPNELANIKKVWNYHEHPDFSCFMITLETFERMGAFTHYEPAFFEDNDAHHRAIMQGYKMWGTDWAPYSHIASRTRDGNPNLVDHVTFRTNKVRFFKEFLTDTCDQSVAEARYAHWLESHPDEKHPNYKDVIQHCLDTGFIGQDVLSWLEKLTIMNVPN